MKKDNICKFVTSYKNEGLKTINFIYETDVNTIRNKITLKNNVLILTVGGVGEFNFDNQKISLTVGQLVFGFENETFYVTNDVGVEYFYISFNGSRIDELFKRFNINKFNRVFENQQGLIPFWTDSLTRAEKDNIDLLSEGVLLYSLSKLKKYNVNNENVVYKLIEYVEKNFDDVDFSLQKLADEWSYNSKYLSVVFKKKTGIGFVEYLKNIRLKHAVFLIEKGVNSVKNIAYLCGFKDSMYFSKVFKQDLGVSPKEYINKQFD
jgi:AraC-like DNA-binding protein